MSTGPYLSVATFCEKVMQETDGVLSMIRMIDRIYFESNEPEAAVDKIVVPVVLLVGFRAGEYRGSGHVEVRVTTPSGKVGVTPIEFDCEFRDEAPGTATAININFQFSEVGTHWFTVRFEGAEVTRIPLELRPRSEAQFPSTPSEVDATPSQQS